jgi:Cdc6-like AAA superfamily ATPase
MRRIIKLCESYGPILSDNQRRVNNEKAGSTKEEHTKTHRLTRPVRNLHFINKLKTKKFTFSFAVGEGLEPPRSG